MVFAQRKAGCRAAARSEPVTWRSWMRPGCQAIQRNRCPPSLTTVVPASSQAVCRATSHGLGSEETVDQWNAKCLFLTMVVSFLVLINTPHIIGRRQHPPHASLHCAPLLLPRIGDMAGYDIPPFRAFHRGPI